MSVVTVDREGHLLMIGVNRPEAYNLWDLEVIQEVSRAYKELGDDPDLRVGVLYGHGKRFTAGLDLPSVAPAIASGDVSAVIPADGYDPWNFLGEPCPKPVVIAAHRTCNTLGIELMLAAEVAIAAEGTRFAQLEVARGIFPFGGATFRLPVRLGPAGMQLLLTAEQFDAETAFRLGLISEVTPPGSHLDRAMEIAGTIASNAPLAVQAALASARAAEKAAREATSVVLFESLERIVTSADAMEGMAAMMERRDPVFRGE